MKRSPDDDEISMPAGTRQRKGGSERRSGATGEALVADSPAQDHRTDFADSDDVSDDELTGLNFSWTKIKSSLACTANAGTSVSSSQLISKKRAITALDTSASCESAKTLVTL